MVLQEAFSTLSLSISAAIALPVLLVLVLIVCLSCLKKKTAGGFSNFSNSAESTNTSHAHVNTTFSADIDDTNVDDANSTAITLESLPDVAAKAKLPQCPLRPRMGTMDKENQDASLKMIAVHHPFPRSQIMYLKELGSGWFGKVIESDAEKITTRVARSKVMVKMLKDDASKDEQQLFFDEVAPFRELEHPNIIRVLGQCTEINPMLMIMEHAAFGNLKQYLRSHRQQQAALVHRNRLIQFALDVSRGLACLHGHNYLHRDLSARNCLVMSDHTLKIGDYGIAEDLFKEDYLTSGCNLLPIRWMAPETLKQENDTWISQNFSKESDVWSLGVVLWEIAMLGERPYDMLTDEAVLQGVIMDKDIRLPEPDIGIPQKDRLYEVMRFCWLEPSERIKVDEAYKLLQQIASKSPEHGASNDAITVFEQKWEHLMPNQRHPSVDSIDDNRLGSVSSEDSNILANALAQPYSLEELTTPQIQPMPQAPPRAARKKVSAGAFEIPKADDMSSTPAAAKKQVTEQVAPPHITVTDEAGQITTTKQEVQAPQLPVESSKPEESKRQSASDVEFTEFTSHNVDDKTSNTPDSFPCASPPDKAVESSPVKASTDVGAMGDHFQVDSMSAVNTTLESDIFTLSTPDRSEGKAKTRKTSTPYAQGEASPSSSSSGGDSSATFVTASTSSLGNFTDAYATASDSTLITDPPKTKLTSSDSSAFGNLSGDSSLSFEILDTTAIPPNSNDSGKSEEVSQNTQMSSPFSPATSSGTNPFTGDIGSILKDDTFGEFTDASVADENNSSAVLSPPAALASSSDSSAAHNFFSSTEESPEDVSKPQSSEASSSSEKSSSESKPATQEAGIFASFETYLSSDGKKSGEKLDQDQVFTSFTSEFSSLNSFSTDSVATPPVEPQNDMFAFDNTVQSQESEKNNALPTETETQDMSPSLEDFAFDSESSVTDAMGIASATSTGKGSDQPNPDLFGDFSSVPLASSSTNPFTGLTMDASPDSGNQSGMQQSATDLFGLREPEANTHDSSFEVLGSPESSRASATSETFSDFDMLGSFTSGLASSTSPSNPSSGGEGLLQDLAGSTLSASPAQAQKESQDDVLVMSSPSDANKSPEASLLDFSEFESPNTTASTDEGKAEKPTSEGSNASSLIDF